MDHIPTPKDALQQLIDALGPKKKAALSPAIQALTLLVDPPKRGGPGSFWQDPVRGAAARAAMSASWAARGTTKLQLTWRSTGNQEVLTKYEEAAKKVGRAAHTIRIYLSKGKGVAHFAYGDDVITIQRL